MTDEEVIKTTLRNGVYTLTFNRPEAMNAMNHLMGIRVREAIGLAARDPEVRVVILTGAGRAFSAGGDMKGSSKADPKDPVAAQYGDDPRSYPPEVLRDRLMDTVLKYDLLRTMPKPTIAMVNGPAVGAGMSVALACDFRICSEAAYFNTTYAALGLSGDVGISFHLTNAVGPAKARELLFFPRKINAEEALRVGLVTKVVSPASLLDETMAMANQLAQGPTLAFGHLKGNIIAALELGPHAAFDIEARNFARCAETADHRESVAAFKEKRQPVFRGR